ncbi:unnamed protein product, partial [Mesorhabditis belari]|uniref:Uncharacterized protein n=1 Tax=Mesorhabditis belari TaxID=2138241 RepID=A0AAF3EHB6_9BILA
MAIRRESTHEQPSGSQSRLWVEVADPDLTEEEKENQSVISECVCGCRICSGRVEAFTRENARLMREIERLRLRVQALESSSHSDENSSSSISRRPPTPVGKVAPVSRKHKRESASTDISQSLSSTITSSHRSSASREIWNENSNETRERSSMVARTRNEEIVLPTMINLPLISTPIHRPRAERSHQTTPVIPSRSPTRLPPGARLQASSMGRLPIIRPQTETTNTRIRRAPSLRSRHESPNRTFIITSIRRDPSPAPARRTPILQPNQSSSSADEQVVIERLGSPTIPISQMTLMQRLLVKRPEFVRHCTERQDRIKQASMLRKTIHQRKLHTAALLAEDLIPLEDALPVLREDPNRVRAFTPESVRGRTRRVYQTTLEYQRRQHEREREVERAAARIIAHFSAEEQRRLRLRAVAH